MDAMWLIVICALNFGISWWNAYVVGRMWGDRPVMGGFMRLVLYSAALMSALGFSSVFIIALTMLASAFLEPEQAQLLMQYAMSTWYVLVVFPWLGSGLVITLHSWIQLFRTPSWVDLATTGWNTFAMVKNVYDASQNLGPALDMVGQMFSSLLSGGSDRDGKAAIARLALALVLLSIVGGFLLTAMIIKAQAAKHRIPEDALQAAVKANPSSLVYEVAHRGPPRRRA